MPEAYFEEKMYRLGTILRPSNTPSESPGVPPLFHTVREGCIDDARELVTLMHLGIAIWYNAASVDQPAVLARARSASGPP